MTESMNGLLQDSFSPGDDRISQIQPSNHTCECEALSKKAVKRLERYERIKQWKKAQRRTRQENGRSHESGSNSRAGVEKQSHPASKRPTKAEIKNLISTRLQSIQESHTTPKVCIDLGLGHIMNKKEIDRLTNHIRMVYGSNRRAANPLHLTFSSLEKGSPIHEACLRRNDGFSQYKVDMSDQSYTNIFPLDKITYLTPDSKEALDCLEIDRVYVIGGLVDESPNKDHTLRSAEELGVRTARLPITEFLKHGPTGSYNKILSINQIFDILLSYHASGDWTEALISGIPKRKGFIPK